MSSTVERIILAGFGGQGIHSLGRILAETGMNVGKSVSCITFGNDDLSNCDSNCSVILADNEIASPMVTVPDAVIAMNKDALSKYSYKIKAGGMLMYDSSVIERQQFRDDIRLYEIPANAIAKEIGDVSLAGFVMAGAYARFSKQFTLEDVINALPQMLKEFDESVITLDKAAITRGYNYVAEKKYMFGRYVHSIFKGI